jgi:hypothetical protein
MVSKLERVPGAFVPGILTTGFFSLAGAWRVWLVVIISLLLGAVNVLGVYEKAPGAGNWSTSGGAGWFSGFVLRRNKYKATANKISVFVFIVFSVSRPWAPAVKTLQLCFYL